MYFDEAGKECMRRGGRQASITSMLEIGAESSFDRCVLCLSVFRSVAYEIGQPIASHSFFLEGNQLVLDTILLTYIMIFDIR
jgi:hypothetical protein